MSTFDPTIADEMGGDLVHLMRCTRLAEAGFDAWSGLNDAEQLITAMILDKTNWLPSLRLSIPQTMLHVPARWLEYIWLLGMVFDTHTRKQQAAPD